VVSGNLFAYIIVDYYDPTGILARIGRVIARLSDNGTEIKTQESEGSAYSSPGTSVSVLGNLLNPLLKWN
jgi:hypothetical protein